MYKLTFGLLVLFALFSLIVAIPNPEPDSDKIDELEKRTGLSGWFFAGQGKLYSPSAEGSNACGGINTDDDFVVAIPGMFFDFGKRCETIITIQSADRSDNPKGNRVNATIVDQCDSCSNNVFELSPALWKYITGAPTEFPPQIGIYWSFTGVRV
ncbi:hypothetical protein BJV77DRAFT_733297 [Russula vinacea]|nr:hypothetical protein BJV77DRAFT_733297 [Russula vinacea]